MKLVFLITTNVSASLMMTSLAVNAESGKERIELWAIPGGASCQRILDKILDQYGTSIQIRTNKGVYQEKDSPWKVNNTVAVLMTSYDQYKSIGPQIAQSILKGCAMTPAGVTEVVFHHVRGSGNWAHWRWGRNANGTGYSFLAKCTTGPNPNGGRGHAPPKNWSETYCT